MLRVTPLYGSRWSPEGAAEDPSCTLVEFSGCRCLVNVGAAAALLEGSGDLPEHDCVLLTDSTLHSIGGLPVYYHKMMQMVHQSNNSSGMETSLPPIYATHPTIKMGHATLYDHHSAICMDGGRPPYSLDDVDNVCASIRAIKYAQPVKIVVHSVPLLMVQAHRAGHVVGGAFYSLQRPQDDTTVIVTERYNMARERHLDAATMLQNAATPDVLVTRPGGPALRQILSVQAKQPNAQQSSVSQAQAERNLTEQILSVLRRDGNVLLPTDAAGRVLELLLLLNTLWEQQRLQATYSLIWFAPLAPNVTEFVRSQLEWMAATLGQQFENSQTSTGHPFQLGQVELCTSWADVARCSVNKQSSACVVIASGADLEHGPARDVLLQWAEHPDHAIIFTDSSGATVRSQDTAQSQHLSLEQQQATTQQLPAAAAATVTATMDPDDAAAAEAGEEMGSTLLVGEALGEHQKRSSWTTAGQLLTAWCEAQLQNQEMDDCITVDVNVPVRAPLQGLELQQFGAREEAQRRVRLEEAQKRALLEEVEFARGQLKLGDGGAEDGITTTSTNTSTSAMTTKSISAGSTTAQSRTVARPRKKSRFDSALFIKFSKPLHLTFEIREEAPGIGQPDSYYAQDDGRAASQVLEDDYGIAVQPERFTDIVSGVDPSRFAGGSRRIGEEVSRRGFGYGVEPVKRSGKTTNVVSEDEGVGGVRDDDNDDDDELDERALEAIDLSEGNGIIRGRNGRPPTKVSTMARRLQVLAEVTYIFGFEGRVGSRAARQTVRALQPREVVVLGGPKPPDDSDNGAASLKLVDEVTLLAEAAKSFASGSRNILTPSNGETAELAVGHAAYAVRLIDTPYQTSEEKQASESRPEPIEPYEAKLGACTVSLLDTVATGQKVALDGSIVLAPRRPLPTEDAPSVFLSDGEVLLTDLRAELIALGMKAEYSAHTGYSQLLVNGRVIVRKEHQDTTNTGRMSVEGPLCEDFYTVRSIVCGRYVVL